MPNFRTWILPLATALIVAAPLSAQAGVTDDVANFFGFGAPAPVEDIPAPTADGPITVTASGSIAETVNLADFATPSLADGGGGAIARAFGRDAAAQTVLRRICPRATGLNIFGDAKYLVGPGPESLCPRRHAG